MYTLGHAFIPLGIHAGGLRYHGMAPSVSALVEHGDIEPRAVKQLETFAAAVQFPKAEGLSRRRRAPTPCGWPSTRR